MSYNGGYGDDILGGPNVNDSSNIALGNIINTAVWHQSSVGDVDGYGYNDILYLNDTSSAELTLSLSDVMDLGKQMDVFNDANFETGTTRLGQSISRHQMVIMGDDDTVNIKSTNDWDQTSVGTVVRDGETYNVYNSLGSHQGQLIIDRDLTLDFMI